MAPTNQQIAVMHPQIKNVWWAMKQMLFLAEYLAKYNQVTFYTFDQSGHDSSNDSFSIYSLFWSYPLKALSFIIYSYKVRKSDYIFVWNSPMHFVAVLSKILFFSRAKVIWWHHHIPWYYSHAGTRIYIKKHIEKHLLSYVDTMIWNSRFLQYTLQNLYKKDIWLLYPIIDTMYYNSSAQSKALTYKKTLFAMSRWEKWKWLADVFQVYDALKQDFDLDLTVAGDWPELQTFRERYSDDSCVQFVWKTNVQQNIQYFQAADVFLFLSQIDSFGMTIIESLLCHTPVVSYELWEAAYIIQNWKNGFMWKDTQDIIDSTKIFLKDEILYKKLVQNCRKSIISNYGMDHFEQQLSTIFSEI